MRKPFAVASEHPRRPRLGSIEARAENSPLFDLLPFPASDFIALTLMQRSHGRKSPWTIRALAFSAQNGPHGGF